MGDGSGLRFMLSARSGNRGFLSRKRAKGSLAKSLRTRLFINITSRKKAMRINATSEASVTPMMAPLFSFGSFPTDTKSLGASSVAEACGMMPRLVDVTEIELVRVVETGIELSAVVDNAAMDVRVGLGVVIESVGDGVGCGKPVKSVPVGREPPSPLPPFQFPGSPPPLSPEPSCPPGC